MSPAAPSPRRARPARRNHLPFETEAPELPGRVHTFLGERFARATQLAIRADWRVWKAWCERQAPPRSVFPATPPDLREFIAACSPPVVRDSRGTSGVAIGRPENVEVRAATTLVRYLNSIGVLHRLAGLPDPTRDPLVSSARRLYTRGRMASAQKAPLGLALILKVCGALPDDTLWHLRAKALLLTAHSTMARRSELVALRVEDLQSTPRGEGVALLRRSKGDQDGQGAERYLSAQAVTALRRWFDGAGIAQGPVFRRLFPGGRAGPSPVTPHEVARIVRAAVARYAESLPEQQRRRELPQLSRIGGHSTRIGAAQDLVSNRADLVAVMQAGGWRSTAMPALYTRRLSALRGGMASLYREAVTEHGEALPDPHDLQATSAPVLTSVASLAGDLRPRRRISRSGPRRKSPAKR
jgi:integrase/recombinase XerD